MRALFNQFTYKRNKAAWQRVAAWMGPQVFADFPEADAARIFLVPVAFPPPDRLAVTGDVTWGERFWVTRLSRDGG